MYMVMKPAQAWQAFRSLLFLILLPIHISAQPYTELVGMLGRAPTAPEIIGYFAQYPLQNSPRDAFKLMGVGLANNFYGNQLVSRTGYDESDIVDYNSYSVRLNGGLYYKITNDIEASLVAYWGTGTTVYTGADRYALKNFKLGQYKAEVRGRNFFCKSYTTQENSGDSYTATTAALAVNNAWLSNSEWFATYSATYSGARAQGAPDAAAHAAARARSRSEQGPSRFRCFQNAFR